MKGMWSGGMRIAKIFGIEIWLDYSWLIIFFLILITFTAGLLPAQYPGLSRPTAVVTGVITTLLFFASVIAHELSHSVYAKSQGLEIRRITLFVFGGASELTDEPKSPGQEFIMSALGPLTSLALGALFGAVWLAGRGLSYLPLTALGGILSIINVSLGIFNLLPGFPLDGGRMLRSIIWKRTGSLEKSTRYASVTGQIVAVLLMLYGLAEILFARLTGGLWLILIGLFLYQAATISYQQTMLRLALKDAKVSDIMRRKFVSVPRAMRARDFLDGYTLRYKDPLVVVEPDAAHPPGVVDARRIPDKALDESVGQFTQKESPVLEPDDPAKKALDIMMRTGLPKLPVTKKGRLVGVLTASHMYTYITSKDKARQEN